MPQLAESLVSATIAKWLKQPGEKVEQYEPICEVMTDKVNAEIPSTIDGVMVELIAEEGQNVSVGEIICRMAAAAWGSGFRRTNAANGFGGFERFFRRCRRRSVHEKPLFAGCADARRAAWRRSEPDPGNGNGRPNYAQGRPCVRGKGRGCSAAAASSRSSACPGGSAVAVQGFAARRSGRHAGAIHSGSAADPKEIPACICRNRRKFRRSRWKEANAKR